MHWEFNVLTSRRSPAQVSHGLDTAGSQKAKGPKQGNLPEEGAVQERLRGSLEGQKEDTGTDQLLLEDTVKTGGQDGRRGSAHEENPHLPPIQPGKMENLKDQKLQDIL